MTIIISLSRLFRRVSKLEDDVEESDEDFDGEFKEIFRQRIKNKIKALFEEVNLDFEKRLLESIDALRLEYLGVDELVEENSDLEEAGYSRAF